MRFSRVRSIFAVAVLTLLSLMPASIPGQAAQRPTQARAEAQQHWVATWAASPQAPRAAPGQAAGPTSAFNNQTLRMIVRTSIGGRRVRVQLSNAHGASPLVVGAARVALHGKDSAIVEATDRAISFNGKNSTTIPAGALMVSDPVDLEVPKLSDLVISIYVPGDTGAATMHGTGLRTTYISKQGDFTKQAMIADATTTQSWYWISSVDVVGSPDAATIVTFGDSITDGARSTPNTSHSWPSILAERLLSNPATANIAVVNHGISGNRLLRDGAGVSALARFDRDVLSQAGVKWVILLEGINDIGNGARANAAASDAVTTDELIGALRQMVDRAHTHGIRVIGGTLTPFAGAAYYSENGEAIRDALNRWIRTGGAFDAVVDFDAVTRDPGNPKQFRQDVDSGDHLHPGDAGYKAMADAIDLSLFSSKK